MGVESTNADYERYAPQWKKCRDATAGQSAIHAGRTRYLPKLNGQTNEEYNAYLMRALFYEATGRTVEGLTGMIFRKPPTVAPGAMKEFIADVTATGVSLEDFAKKVVKEVLTVGRFGLLIDFTSIDTAEMTQQQAKQAGSRAFWKSYPAASIINWRFNQKLEEVRLLEVVEVIENEFDVKYKEQIRVLDFEDGVYRQRVFEKQRTKEGKVTWVVMDTLYPIKNGEFLTEIPFYFVSVDGKQGEIEEPPLLGLVNVNLSHYMTTADLEHGAHFTGLPTPYVTGVQIDDKNPPSFTIGAARAWVFPNADSKVGYLEFEGKGLETLQELLKSKEEKMASLGAQMLTPETRRNEAADTAEMRHMGENSILSSIAKTISEILNKALIVTGEWEGLSPADIQLNQDFLAAKMTPEMLKALVDSWIKGGISEQTLFDNLKAGEIIDSDKSYDIEKSEKETNPIEIV